MTGTIFSLKAVSPFNRLPLLYIKVHQTQMVSTLPRVLQNTESNSSSALVCGAAAVQLSINLCRKNGSLETLSIDFAQSNSEDNLCTIGQCLGFADLNDQRHCQYIRCHQALHATAPQGTVCAPFSKGF